MSLKRVATKKDITPRIAAQTLPSQYPIEWFNSNPDSKPPLSISLNSEDLNVARKLVKKGVSDDTISIGSANTYLYYYAQTLKIKLDENWTFYNRVIGLKDEEITPLALFDVTEKAERENANGDDSAVAKDDPWLVGWILSVYRILRTNNASYQSDISDRIKNHLTGIVGSELTAISPSNKYNNWLSNKVYNKLVAGYDIYFHRFPEHPLSSLRICTTGTRHRDCAGLLSYGYLADVLGLHNVVSILDWVFLETIANDIDRMMREEDELTEPFSYFPYQVDMGLVHKSSYSATINTCFFEWVHLICAMMGSARSKNAKHITDKQSSDIFANAACVAYVHATNFEFTKAYTETGEPIKFDQDESDENTDDREDLLRSKDSTDWLLLIKSEKGVLPESVRTFVKKVSQSIKDPRAGTIDEHLLKKAATII